MAFLLIVPAGCGGEKVPAQSGSVPENSTGNTQIQVIGTPADETPVLDEKAAAREAYLDFLNGKGTVTTTEAFRREEGDYPWYTPAYGTYSYEELKYAAAEEMMGSGTARYTFLDVGGAAGAELLALRFENEDPSFLNWTGIIRYDGGALTLTYSYEDGYRVEGELFTSGFLRIGGSGGAGAHEESGYLLEEDGTAGELYEAFDYWSSWAPDIRYRLEESQRGPMEDKYLELPPTFCVRGYSDENGLKVYAEYSEDADPEVRALEEDFVSELTKRGVRLVDWETFSGLFDQASEYSAQEVSWTDFDDGLPSPVG